MRQWPPILAPGTLSSYSIPNPPSPRQLQHFKPPSTAHLGIGHACQCQGQPYLAEQVVNWLVKFTSDFSENYCYKRSTIMKKHNSRTDEGEPRLKHIFNKCGTNIYFFTLQRFGSSPSQNCKVNQHCDSCSCWYFLTLGQSHLRSHTGLTHNGWKII